jgi:hypothetical protein
MAWYYGMVPQKKCCAAIDKPIDQRKKEMKEGKAKQSKARRDKTRPSPKGDGRIAVCGQEQETKEKNEDGIESNVWCFRWSR